MKLYQVCAVTYGGVQVQHVNAYSAQEAERVALQKIHRLVKAVITRREAA